MNSINMNSNLYSDFFFTSFFSYSISEALSELSVLLLYLHYTEVFHKLL